MGGHARGPCGAAGAGTNSRRSRLSGAACTTCVELELVCATLGSFFRSRKRLILENLDVVSGPVLSGLHYVCEQAP